MYNMYEQLQAQQNFVSRLSSVSAMLATTQKTIQPSLKTCMEETISQQLQNSTRQYIIICLKAAGQSEMRSDKSQKTILMSK